MLGWAMAFIALATIFILGAVLLWLWALYLLVADVMTPYIAAAIVGLGAVAVAGILAWRAQQLTR